MSRKYKILIIFFALLAGLWAVGKMTRMFTMFTSPTTSNYPTLKPGKKFFASNLVQPKRFSLICYYSENPDYGRQLISHRLCGIEGDKIEIRKGDLYVNDKYVDSELPIAHNYFMTYAEVDKLNLSEKEEEQGLVKNISGDSLIVTLPINTNENILSKSRRQILDKNYIDENIQKQFQAPWNQDNFGPLIVPQGKYFVLGDNRLNSLDSRYLGFVDKSDYVATVLWK